MRRREALVLLTAGHYPGAYYLAGYAVECALKACVAKQVRRYDFPDKKLANEAFTHDLTKLMKLSGLAPELTKEMELNKSLELNWAVVKDWSESTRYETGTTETQARDLYSACTARTNKWCAKLDQAKMVEENLTNELIDAGAKLVKKLDERGLAPDVAFWLYSPEEQTWKLLLVDVKLAKRGPRAAYAEVQKILDASPKELKNIKLNDLVVEKPDARIVQVIRKAVRTGPAVSGIRFKNNVVDGTLIDDAYIYRAA